MAQPYFENFENSLSLYDEEERGLITVNDLREGLASFDIYDGKDKTSFDCFALYLLSLNHKNTEYVKISDVMQTLYPNR